MQALSSEFITSSARRLVEFINHSPSPYHAVEECRRRLLSAGFAELSEKNGWSIEKGGKYFLTRNKSSLIAFAVGKKYDPGNGFTIIGAHTDSPCLKVKPVSKRIKSGYLSVGVEMYGGGIWQTWFDRDLTIAGRVVVKENDSLKHKLLNLRKPILRVPHLCIHLQRGMNDNFTANKETQIVPVLATQAQASLNSSGNKDENSGETEKHHSLFTKIVCDELNCQPEDILDFDLCLADTQDAVVGGALDEFVFAPRLDNLFNCFCSLEGLIDSCATDDLENEVNVRMICLFDNEECGSQSAQGAGSKITELIMKRIVSNLGGCFERSVANSYLLSADQSHAVHPNYADKHEDNHKPAFHGGPVLKINSNQRYATTAVTSSIMRAIAAKCNVPLQDFIVRNDSPCGSTIGPILSAGLGMRTLDIGGPTLSMHSIREMSCTTSAAQCVVLFKAFFEEFPVVDASFQLE